MTSLIRATLFVAVSATALLIPVAKQIDSQSTALAYPPRAPYSATREPGGSSGTVTTATPARRPKSSSGRVQISSRFTRSPLLTHSVSAVVSKRRSPATRRAATIPLLQRQRQRRLRRLRFLAIQRLPSRPRTPSRVTLDRQPRRNLRLPRPINHNDPMRRNKPTRLRRTIKRQQAALQPLRRRRVSQIVGSHRLPHRPGRPRQRPRRRRPARRHRSRPHRPHPEQTITNPPLLTVEARSRLTLVVRSDVRSARARLRR